MDTGSAVSLIKHSLAQRLAVNFDLKINASTKRLKTVSGSVLDITGSIDVLFNIGNSSIVHRLVICDDKSIFTGALLLGRDFLNRTDASISFSRLHGNYVRIADRKYTFHKLRTMASICYIEDAAPTVKYFSMARAPHDFTIEPSVGYHDYARVPSHMNNKMVILFPAAKPVSNSIVFPRIIAYVRDGKVPVTLFNCSDSEVKIRAGTIVARIELLPESSVESQEARTVACDLCEPHGEPHSEPQSAGATHADRENGTGGACEGDYVNFVTDTDQSEVQPCSDTPNTDLICDELYTYDNDFNELIDSLRLNHVPIEERSRLVNLLYQHRKAISVKGEVGKVSICKHRIDTQGHLPVNVPQYRIPHHAKKVVEEHVENMLREGVIEPACSPWNSPVVLVKKQNGSFRFCVDYRKLNDVIRKDVFPIPRINEVLENLKGASVFSTLDMKHGYHNIELEEGSRDCTAFKTDSGSYRYARCPQGLATSSSGYQRACNLAFSKQLGKFVYAYIDDLVVFSTDFDQHLEHLRELLEQVEATGFKLGLEKCQFAQKTVKYLGHVVDATGIRVDPDKTAAIAEMSPPTNAKGVRRFLGCCSYYRKFIRNFAGIASPLTELTKKNKKFCWNDECQTSFDILKDRLTSAPVLAFPDYTKKFKLHCDASKISVGAVLNQQTDDGERAIGYFSRKLKNGELNYSVTEVEALAVFEGVKFFAPYLWGCSFDIYTDHSALRYIFKYKNSIPRVARWSMYLADFNYNIHYKDGKSHVVPDFLSRLDHDQADVVGSIEEEPVEFERDVLIREQKADPLWSRVRQALEGADVNLPRLVSIDDYLIDEDVLYKCPRFKSHSSYKNLQIVVPSSMIKQALHLSHDSNIAAHMGILRTLERARSSFFWLHQAKDVKEYVKCCVPCQKRKWQGQKVAQLGNFPPVSRPLERVGLDLVEMPQSYAGNKYFLTIIDHFTRYVSAHPLHDKSAETVARALMSYISQNSVPENIVSDRGSEFTNDLFKRVCAHLQVKCKLTTAYHPMANGATEKANSTIKQALSHLAQDDRFTWDEQLPLATLAINTAYQSSIKEIPFFLQHGRDARLPFNDLVNKSPVVNYSENDYAKEMAGRLAKAFASVKNMSKLAHETAAKYYNRKKHVVDSPMIEIGSMVLLRNETGKSEAPLAWPTRYIGPYRVVDRFNNNFVIKGIYADTATQTVHLNRLKIAHLRDDVGYPFNNNNDAQDDSSAKDDLPTRNEASPSKVNAPAPRYNLRSANK